jgi:hypothetical protein
MRGGAREGAGRKAGTANVKSREIADKAAAQGLTPLEYMLAVMRNDEADSGRRDDMAKAAAPYIHARLAAVEHKGNVPMMPPTINVKELTDDQLRAIASIPIRDGEGW